MSKANQKFAQADDAVSPVIGVILMVAITVVLAAVVFVLVSNLSKGTGNANEDAAVTMSSPSNNTIYLTLVRGGANVPYTFAATAATSEVIITIDGNYCDHPSDGTPSGSDFATKDGNLTDSDGDAQWGVSETVKLHTDCSTANGGGILLLSGSTHLVSVTLHGTLILDNSKVIIS
jgi:flagellin-like protein